MSKTQKAKAKQTKGVLYIMGKTGKAGIILSMIAVQVLGTSAVSMAQVYTDANWRDKANPIVESDAANEFVISLGSTLLEYGYVNILVRSSDVTITATQGSNIASEPNPTDRDIWWGVSTTTYARLTLNAAENNEISGMGLRDYGLGVYGGSVVNLNASVDNKINGTFYAAYVTARDYYTGEYASSSTLNLTASGDNKLYVHSAVQNYGSSSSAIAVGAVRSGEVNIHSTSGSNRLTAEAVDDAEVFFASHGGNISMIAENGSNVITATALSGSDDPYSYQTIEGVYLQRGSTGYIRAGKDNVITVTGTGAQPRDEAAGIQCLLGSTLDVIAEEGSNVFTVNGPMSYGIVVVHNNAALTVQAAQGNNEITAGAVGIYTRNTGKADITTRAGLNKITADEYGMLALVDGKINLTGQTQVTAPRALNADGLNSQNNDAASVTINYDGSSSVSGDVYAYNGGHVEVKPIADSAFNARKMNITGDIYAAYQDADDTPDPATYVGGTTDISLTSDSTLTGKILTFYSADDYGTDRAGTANLTMDAGSLWLMTGSSSVSSLANNGTVRFRSGGDSLQITDMTGSGVYELDLSMTGSNSDMIYAVNGTSEAQTLTVKNLITLDSEMNAGDAVRFATIKNSQNEFVDGRTVGIIPSGIYNDTLKIQYRNYETDPLNTAEYNDAYNGDGTLKPTTAQVESLYGGAGAKNVYLVKSQSMNDGAVTPGAIKDLVWRYVTDLDTFTKRRGQAQYFIPGSNDGFWVRAAHKKLGIDGTGSISGNTYELGYSSVQNDDEKEKHRMGAALAGSRQTGHLENFASSLKVKDGYLAVYDTHEYLPDREKFAGKPEWKKDTFRYWDNYLKIHRVKTEYDASDRLTGARYEGSYRQSVIALSTEYGAKLPFAKRWYWVPQAQLQLSYVQGYDYSDSQDIYFKGDDEWSLVGRLGFDLVHVVDEKHDGRLHLKASLLHEFSDGTDVRAETYGAGAGTYFARGEQSGTWGVFGIGYSSRLGSSAYLHLDAEWAAGNDFDDTYFLTAALHVEL